MDEFFLNLISAEQLVISTGGVHGNFFLELFAGCKLVTLCIAAQRILCGCPWTIKHGQRFNIADNGGVLLAFDSLAG